MQTAILFLRLYLSHLKSHYLAMTKGLRIRLPHILDKTQQTKGPGDPDTALDLVPKRECLRRAVQCISRLCVARKVNYLHARDGVMWPAREARFEVTRILLMIWRRYASLKIKAAKISRESMWGKFASHMPK